MTTLTATPAPTPEHLAFFAQVPPEVFTVSGVIVAAVLTLIGAVVGHLTTARAARRATQVSRDQQAGELALDLAKQATTDVAAMRGEVATYRTEITAERTRFVGAYVHASTLHYQWPADQLPVRPDWPTTLPSPAPGGTP